MPRDVAHEIAILYALVCILGLLVALAGNAIDSRWPEHRVGGHVLIAGIALAIATALTGIAHAVVVTAMRVLAWC